MSDQARPAKPAHRAGLARSIFETGSALSMTVGRAPVARLVADQARLAAGDKIADVGCGPGTAVREAVRRGASATGIDPSQAALRIARLCTPAAMSASARWAAGCAEALPLEDGAVTVVWAIRSAHHFDDQAAAIGEIRRVLGPGGRVLLADRLIEPGARGHAAHGLTRAQADDLAGQLAAAGFADVGCEVRQAGRRTMILVSGVLA